MIAISMLLEVHCKLINHNSQSYSHISEYIWVGINIYYVFTAKVEMFRFIWMNFLILILMQNELHKYV